MELGQLLHQKLFGSLLPVDEEMFVSSMAVLERLSARRGDHHEAENFYFSVFSEGKEAIDRQCESTGYIVLNNIPAQYCINTPRMHSEASKHNVLSSNFACTLPLATIPSFFISHSNAWIRYNISFFRQWSGVGSRPNVSVIDILGLEGDTKLGFAPL